MAVVVIGGSTRNIGKTSVVAGLIAALPEMHWTAVKITQFGHGICSANGKACDCVTADHSMAMTEERDRTGKTDSSRYLVAGAERSVWVRTQQGSLFEAMPRIRQEFERAQNVIVESNSILRFLRPDLYLSVLDPNIEDFKSSAKRYLDRADAVLIPQAGEKRAVWPGTMHKLPGALRIMTFRPPEYVTEEMTRFVAERVRVD